MSAETKRDQLAAALAEHSGIFQPNKTQNDYEWFLEWAAGSRRLIMCFDGDEYSLLAVESGRIVHEDYGTDAPLLPDVLALARDFTAQVEALL